MDFAFGVMLVAASITHADGTPHIDSHVRTPDTELQVAIASGIARSPLFRDLLAQLNASNVVVYLMTDCAMPERLRGRLTFLASAGGVRYLYVRIAPGLAMADLIAILGHELQHAVEVATAPAVVDESSLAAEYRRIGYQTGPIGESSGYDTRQAIETGRRIRAEVAHRAE